MIMAILKKKVQSVQGDAIIYERDRKDFPDYDDKYLYFTIIKYLSDNKGGEYIE